MIEGVEEDKKYKQPFIKSKVNKVEDSYRSPLSQEFYPKQITNVFIPVNVTKVEKNLNMLMQEYCSMMYLNGVISTVFFADFTTNHTMHFMLRKEIPEGNRFFKKGYYQIRIVIEIGQNYYKKSGYLEYYLEVEDVDNCRHIIQGTIPKDEDRRTKPEKPLDIKNFNYKEAGAFYTKLEQSFYQQLIGIVFKQRPSLNEECRLDPERRKNHESSLNIIRLMKKEFEEKVAADQKTQGFYRSVNTVLMGARQQIRHAHQSNH